MIVRRRHNSCFTIVPNSIWEDDRISIEAKGTLGYLLSRPDDWNVHLWQVGNTLNVGRERMQRIFRELIAADYVIKAEAQSRAGGSFSGFEYEVYDDLAAARNRKGVAPVPQSAKPSTVKPSTVKQPAYKERETKKYKLSSAECAEPPAGFQESKAEKQPSHALGADQGLIQRRIAERIGPTIEAGFAILFDLPAGEIDQLCARERRGTLDDRTVEKLRLSHRQLGRGVC